MHLRLDRRLFGLPRGVRRRRYQSKVNGGAQVAFVATCQSQVQRQARRTLDPTLA
jgi:hypothetical protein